MAFTKTLAQVSRMSQYLSDTIGQVGVGTNFRHEQADVFDLASDLYRDLRTTVTALGFTEFLDATAPAPLPTTVSAGDTGEQFVRVPSPTGALVLKGLDVLKRDQWRELSLISWSQRRNSQLKWDDGGLPNYWSEISIGSVATNVLTAGTIGVFPKPTRTAQYRIWYLPEFTSVTSSTDLFLYRDASWYQWHVNSVAFVMAGIRDNDAKKRADNCRIRIAEAYENMKDLAPKRQVDTATSVMRADDYHS